MAMLSTAILCLYQSQAECFEELEIRERMKNIRRADLLNYQLQLVSDLNVFFYNNLPFVQDQRAARGREL